MATAKDSDSDVVHNFLTESVWILLAGFAGFKRGTLKYHLYNIYRFMLHLLTLSIITMAFSAAVICLDDIIQSLQCVQMGTLILEFWIDECTRYFPQFKSLCKTMEIFQSGVFLYKEDILSEDYREIKRKCVADIRKATFFFQTFLISVATCNLIFVPLTNWLINDVDTSSFVVNPYLPNLPVYFPFDTTTYAGYISAALILTLATLIGIVPIVSCMYTIFASCTIQLIAQFHILNYSLAHLEKRAYSDFLRAKALKREQYLSEKLYDSLEFLNCVKTCFRSNLMHHQTLIRLKNTIEEFTGLILFLIIALTSLILAATVIVILQAPQIYIAANTALLLMCELYFVLNFCRFGEELIGVSSETFEVFYSTPWYNCDKSLKKHLSIAMANSRKPLILKTLLLDFNASMDAFGTIISVMYKVINVLSNT